MHEELSLYHITTTIPSPLHPITPSFLQLHVSPPPPTNPHMAGPACQFPPGAMRQHHHNPADTLYKSGGLVEALCKAPLSPPMSTRTTTASLCRLCY
ncbi:hypothetical protein Pmani_039488 [Petrolisthes manimaculis]|uniref:Uncharacterized protein n=1 Tax=Petrolisthes manimaculis TaxID=1843537 RepID=A0AAE1NE66_9EUCA|nr:hypothetical protein Pmani_039488 [Petrolisthes manimaculis]